MSPHGKFLLENCHEVYGALSDLVGLPILMAEEAINPVEVPARSGIVAEMFEDEKGNFHARVVDKVDYFWSPVKQLSVKE